MARRVKVSSLGKSPPKFPVEQENIDLSVLATNMIEFWRAEIDLVLPDSPDLIVLHEMFDRYVGTPRELLKAYREAMGDRMMVTLEEIARQNNCYIVYAGARPVDTNGRSLEKGRWKNAAVMIDRTGGIIGQYDKNHTVVTEIDMGILCGSGTPIIECDFGTVGFVICFDLNFDELRLKYKELSPDLLIFPSMYHGGSMQSYWAYSCRAHFVGSIGLDNLPNEFYSPVGHRIATSTNYFSALTATLNLDCAVAHLDFNGSKLRDLKKKYGREVTIFDPGQLGSVLITSESDTVSVTQMVSEFGIELLDDYFARSLNYHHLSRGDGYGAG